MVESGEERPKMAQIVQKGKKWPNFAKNGQNWPKWPKTSKTVRNDQKWLKRPKSAKKRAKTTMTKIVKNIANETGSAKNQPKIIKWLIFELDSENVYLIDDS